MLGVECQGMKKRKRDKIEIWRRKRHLWLYRRCNNNIVYIHIYVYMFIYTRDTYRYNTHVRCTDTRSHYTYTLDTDRNTRREVHYVYVFVDESHLRVRFKDFSIADHRLVELLRDIYLPVTHTSFESTHVVRSLVSFFPLFDLYFSF